MNSKEEASGRAEAVFPATVVAVIDSRKVAINKGSVHGVKLNQRFLIYALGKEEILDPATGESLGYLELVKGVGKVIHVQEKMATIESERKEESQRTIVKTSSSPASVISALSGLLSERRDTVEETILPSTSIVPFESPVVGDRAKPI